MFGDIYRFGPVLQQGYISSIAPYDDSSVIHRLLLDVRTSRGMSGSPVFHPSTGEVLAVHSAGIESVVAFAVPLTTPMVTDMLAAQETGEIGTQAERTMSAALRTSKREEPA